jgi:hypothetical protein
MRDFVRRRTVEDAAIPRRRSVFRPANDHNDVYAPTQLSVAKNNSGLLSLASAPPTPGNLACGDVLALLMTGYHRIRYAPRCSIAHRMAHR